MSRDIERAPWLNELVGLICATTGINPQASEPENYVENLITETLISDREERWTSVSFTPSSLHSICIRKEVFKRLEDVWEDVDTGHDADLYRRFELGNILHDQIQNDLLAKSQKLWGNWRCSSCGSVQVHTTLPDPCPNELEITDPEGGSVRRICNRRGANWEYLELKLRSVSEDIKYQVRGRADGVLLYPDGWRSVEFKSLAPDLFQGFSRVKGESITEIPNSWILKPGGIPLPKADHLFQNSLYAAMLYMESSLGRLPLDPEKCLGSVTVYVDKETLHTKEFYAPLNLAILDHVADTINYVKELEMKKAPMEGPRKCSNRQSWRAKICPWRDTCFPLKRKPKSS